MTVAYEYGKSIRKPSFIFSPWIEKKIWATLEDGIHHLSVHLNDYKPELLSDKRKELKNNVLSLYREFEPDLFKDKLLSFLIETVPMERLKHRVHSGQNNQSALIITYNRSIT
jgi:heptosyltransferase-2